MERLDALMNHRKAAAAAMIGLVLIVAVVGLHLLSQPSTADDEQNPVIPPGEPDNRT
jgi:hypothetical protein